MKPTKLELAAIDALNQMSRGDPERAHSSADNLLLGVVHPDVAAAYRALADGCSFWACA